MLSDCNFEFAIIEICYDRIDTCRVYGTITINKEVQEEVPKIDLRMNMIYLGWWGYTGIGMNVEDVKVILEKCLKENKYFKVWRMNWKGDIGDMPMDWWEEKVAYYKYKG